MKVKEKLRTLDVRPSKQRGQNFIIDHTLTDAVAAFGVGLETRDNQSRSSSVVAPSKTVEIGPGLGALTEKLLARGPVIAIEIEERFCEELERRFAGSQHSLEIINEDVRFVDFSQLGSDLIVYGNLPYRLSTDIIFHLLSFGDSIRRAIIMVQREFAARMHAGPGTKDYGVLSVSVQLGASTTLGPVIPGSAFHPPTEVTSQLIALDFRPYPGVATDEVVAVKRVVSAAFSQRRKMIKNTLKASRIADGDKVELALATVGLAGTRRAETVSIEEFVALTRALSPYFNR